VDKGVPLSVKLTLTFLILAALVAGVGIYDVLAIKNIDKSYSALLDQNVARLENLSTIKLEVLELEDTITVTNGVTPSEKRAYVSQAAQDVNESIQSYQKLAPHASEKEQAEFKEAKESIEATIQGALATYPDKPLPATELSAQKMQVTTSTEAAARKVDVVMATVRERPDRANVATLVSNTIRTTLLMVILAALSAVLLGVVMTSRLTQGLSRLKTAARRIANGDFSETTPIVSNDEVGQLAATFNQMSARLRDSYRRLAVEKQRDEAILVSMGEGLIAVDEKADVVLMNPVAASMLELGDAAAMIGHGIQDKVKLYPVGEKTPLAPSKMPLPVVLKTGERLNDVFAYHDKTDHQALFNVSAAPIVLDSKIVGAIAVLRDVTKEKEIDRMKTEFISLASHQLRTPLSAIRWFSEMLVAGDAGKLEPEQLEFANNIADSTERMIALVNALLNISRIESGRIMIDPKPTDLKELVGGIVNDLKAKIEERQQTLIISVHDDLPKINLDPRLIGQVYLNLLTNAVKYTPKGGEVSVFVSKKGDQVVSQVTDNGYGIPKEQQGRLFQKFFRASNAVKVETDGTGLGLYLIKAVIESSGGKIWFESEEGKGSTFWFSIPLSGMKAKAGEVTLES
jgi:signal transduction histidine kinase